MWCSFFLIFKDNYIVVPVSSLFSNRIWSYSCFQEMLFVTNNIKPLKKRITSLVNTKLIKYLCSNYPDPTKKKRNVIFAKGILSSKLQRALILLKNVPQKFNSLFNTFTTTLVDWSKKHKLLVEITPYCYITKLTLWYRKNVCWLEACICKSRKWWKWVNFICSFKV